MIIKKNMQKKEITKEKKCDNLDYHKREGLKKGDNNRKKKKSIITLMIMKKDS